MKRLYMHFVILSLILIVFLPVLQADSFSKSEYKTRRTNLMNSIPDGIAIIRGASFPTGDSRFFQNTDFLYFTGVKIHDAVLIIDGIKRESLLFFTMDEREADSEAIPLKFIRNPVETTGIEKVFPTKRFSEELSALSRHAKIFYTSFRPQELSRDNSKEKFRKIRKSNTLNLWDGRLTRELQFVKQLKDKFPQIVIEDCSSSIWDLRKIKSAAEINLIRKSSQIGVKAHSAVIQSTRPGIIETELAGVFDFICKTKGSHDLAYETILMSGKNFKYGHYHQHDRTLKEGEFVILDAGPDFEYYHCDISSTFPVNGRFSKEQRQLYEIGLGIRKTCLENYKPGISFRDVGQKVKEFLIKSGLDPDYKRYKRYTIYGGYNHMIGMATHDVMGNFAGADEIIKPGFVFACDINIIYPDKELGIRIEDTVAITEEGCENLSSGLERTVKEIESLMAKDGIIQILKKANKYK